jgi:predicted Zn-ribbon and HTH transcriptional regulator
MTLQQVAIVMAIAPIGRAIVYARRSFRKRKVSPNACTNCGYDHRATPLLCPECGTIPEQKPALT